MQELQEQQEMSTSLPPGSRGANSIALMAIMEDGLVLNARMAVDRSLPAIAVCLITLSDCWGRGVAKGGIRVCPRVKDAGDSVTMHMAQS